MRSTQLSPLMGTVVDATNPEAFVAAITAKYEFIKAQQDTPLLFPRISYGDAFRAKRPRKGVMESLPMYQGTGFPLAEYTYVFDNSKRVPITADTVIPKPGTAYCPAYFSDRKCTPLYSVVIRMPKAITAFPQKKTLLEKPMNWNVVENPEEDWF